LGENPGDGRKSPGGKKVTRAGPNLGFGLVVDKKTNLGEGLLELNTERVRSEGRRGAEDEDPGK